MGFFFDTCCCKSDFVDPRAPSVSADNPSRPIKGEKGRLLDLVCQGSDEHEEEKKGSSVSNIPWKPCEYLDLERKKKWDHWKVGAHRKNMS